MNAPILIFKLPAPPTVNNLYLTTASTRGRRRVRSRRYKAWLTEAGWEVQRQRNGCIGGPWEIDIALPAGLKGDTDNYAKPLLDLLVKHRVVDDDKHCRRVTVAKTVSMGSVLVTLRPAS